MAFQARANLVLVDVVVTNNGAAVNGLTKDKFHIFENGEAQQVTVFEEHKPDTAPTVAKVPNFGPNVYSDFPEYAVSSAANVLLLDGLNTPIADQVYARQQMIKYLKNIPPGTRIAVFTLASQLRMVEGFTTDSNTIARALSGKGGPQQSVILDPQTDQQISNSTNDMASLGASQLAQSSMQQFQADLASFQTDVRVQMTLDAMKNLARYLSAIPGRKNLIWFSGSFPLSIDPDSTLQSPFEAMRTYSADVRQTDDMLSAARVAVYPVDARGLMSLPSVSAANNYSASPAGVTGSMSGGGRGSNGKGSGPRTIGGGGGSSQPASAKADQKFMHQTIVEHQTMQQIAEDTGGEAFIDTNGLKEAVAQAIANGSHYYTVGYVPKPKKYDGSFYRIRLNVDGGYQAAYRRGYYADDSSSKAAIVAPGSPSAPQNVMLEAVERGAPPISEIPFKVRVLAADDPSAKDVKPAPGPAGATAKDLKGPVKRYLVDYALDPRPFAFTTTPDGVRHAQFEVAVVAYNADGKRLNYADRGNELNLTPALYEQVIHAGVPMHQEIDLPAGQVYLRVVVHDLGNARIGSTEIPLVVAK
jgi:VWFA-related protein